MVMLYQFFLSPQVKGILVISNKLVYTNCRTTEDLGSYETRKVQNNFKISCNYNHVPSPPPKKKILSILVKDSLKIEIEIFP